MSSAVCPVGKAFAGLPFPCRRDRASPVNGLFLQAFPDGYAPVRRFPAVRMRPGEPAARAGQRCIDRESRQENRLAGFFLSSSGGRYGIVLSGGQDGRSATPEFTFVNINPSGIMAIEKVKAHFERYGIADRIREFPVSSATVELAAKALGCEPARIAKTLAFSAGGKVLVIVTAGDTRIDNARYKARFGTKVRMLSPAEAEESVGHAVGGICPFGIDEAVAVYLDTSLKRFDTVFPACGSSNSAIELSIPELEEYTAYPEWIDVCKKTGA